MNGESSSVVPRNKLQQRFANNTLEHLAPDPFVRMSAPCTILQVYDAETLAEEGVPTELGGLIDTHPGWLFAKVLGRDGQTTMILPFQEPEEHIYFMYGNRVLLEGRAATIQYVNQDSQSGFISLQRNHNEVHLPLIALAQVYDIGKIV